MGNRVIELQVGSNEHYTSQRGRLRAPFKAHPPIKRQHTTQQNHPGNERRSKWQEFRALCLEDTRVIPFTKEEGIQPAFTALSQSEGPTSVLAQAQRPNFFTKPLPPKRGIECTKPKVQIFVYTPEVPMLVFALRGVFCKEDVAKIASCWHRRGGSRLDVLLRG